jgi:hypothetical protein
MPEEHINELPSIEDVVGQGELPSVEDFIELEEEQIQEETQIIDDADGNAKIEVTDLVQAPEWGELLRLINDVKESIPEVPEIKSYDKELEALCEVIDDVRESIPVVPEVRYYEEELEAIKETVQSVKESIPTLPVWIEKVSEVPDFTWVGQTFNTVDERFNSIKDCVQTLSDQIESELTRIQDEKDTFTFESKVDFKTVHDRVDSLKDQIYGQLKEQSDIVWKLQKKLKENQKEFEISFSDQVDNKVDHLQEVTEETAKRIQDSLNEKFEFVGNKLDKEVESLRTKLSSLPKPKYYEEELKKIKKELKNFESLREIVEQIQVRQEKVEDLQENYLLTEPPDEAEDIGSGQDPLTPLDQKFATLSDLASHYRIFINRIQTQMSTMGGGGAGFIKDLDDVDITGLDDEYILQYDSASSKWLTVPNNAGVGGTWFSNDVGVSTTRIVGINTTQAKAGTSLFVVGNIEATGNVNVGGTITYDDVKHVDSLGISTFRSGLIVNTGTATTALLVNGDARVTGILTIGTGSITLDPNEKKISGIDEIIIGTGTTVRIHQDSSGEIAFSDSQGREASVGIGTTVSINTTGIITAATLKASTAFYPPLYTTTARDAGSFSQGAIIFNTTSLKLEFYDGTSWQSLPGMTIGLSVALDG